MKRNNLIHESSPYLLQHAHNPVNWYAWSDEAFATAKTENKPIFLSIGYATCHWCHVMEKESFADEEVARYLNEIFVSIKVDREERPDIDSVYMAACQMLTGSGGWPLTIIMTPDREPFFAGTYIPKHNQFGRLGLIDLCGRVRELWNSQQDSIQDSARSITEKLHTSFAFSPRDDLDPSVLDQAYAQIKQSYDSQFGGFEPAPKFPTPHRLRFLLRHYYRTGQKEALAMAENTLTAMRHGGIWDHVGFGFHRYATDRRWLLPHFEKMLYDQALMAMAYLEIYQITRNSLFAQTADEIFTYVLRDMTSPEGAFFSAEDADSEGEEGKYYVWNYQEFERVLGEETASLWKRIFNLKKEGNFAEEATGRASGTNILQLTRSLDSWGKELNMDSSMVFRQWDDVRKRLFQHREQRIHPLKDDKILTDWNGLMIAALAMGGRILNNPDYSEAARKGCQFIVTHMMDENGQLYHRYRNGVAGLPAYADDYACLILGLLNVYRATFDLSYVNQAIILQNRHISDFWDNEQGGFFMTGIKHEALPIRPKELYDGAIPSGNSVSLYNLIHLSRLTGDLKWEKLANKMVNGFSENLSAQPAAYTHFLMGLDHLLNSGEEVVVTGNSKSSDTREMLSILNQHFSPNRAILHKSDENAGELAELAGFTKELAVSKKGATAYICNQFSCRNPISDPPSLLKHLGQI